MKDHLVLLGALAALLVAFAVTKETRLMDAVLMIAGALAGVARGQAKKEDANAG